MEQHRTLLIIVSIAVVLAAIIGGGIWLFYPRADEAVALDEGRPLATGTLEWEPSDYLLNDGDRPGLDDETTESDEFQVTYGVVYDPQASSDETGDGEEPETTATDATPFVINRVDTPQDESSGSTGTASSDATPTDSTPVTHGTSSDDPTATHTDTGASGTTAGTTTPAGSAAPSTSTAMPQVVGTSSAGSGTATSSTATSTASVADRAYWVQVISSPNRDTVEQAQVTLREHQLGSRILTKEIEGTTYYRLRLGPFAVRSEAEKFLTWVAGIRGFADSMIFVDYSTTVKAAESS